VSERPVNDRFVPRLALAAGGLLQIFNAAGVLDAADVHVAGTLAELGEVDDERVTLAAALAVRAVRAGSVCVDLASVAGSVPIETAVDAATDSDDAGPDAGLPWPDAESWVQAVASCSALVAATGKPVATAEPQDTGLAVSTGSGRESQTPLCLDGSRLYLQRYWRLEQELATALSRLAERPPRPVAPGLLDELLAGLGEVAEDDRVQAALRAATCRGLTVIVGGPGTGKTATIAALVTLLRELAARTDVPAPLIGLCAPTGKAAARLREALSDQSPDAPVGGETGGRDGSDMRERDGDGNGDAPPIECLTLHQLLGWLPGDSFRHHAENRLPYDVVIVDESSMVPLTLMHSLVTALRDDARLVLVGDPDQLTAVEAGAVLRDIAGPAATAATLRVAQDRPGPDGASGQDAATGQGSGPDLTSGPSLNTGPSLSSGPDLNTGPGLTGSVVVLTQEHRYGQEIADLAGAVRQGDAERALELAIATDGGDAAGAGAAAPIRWIQSDAAAGAAAPALAPVRDAALAAFTPLISAARAGEVEVALGALSSFRLLCAHRHGRYGVSGWRTVIERWLQDAVPGFVPTATSAPGYPLTAIANDYELHVSNGDSGVIVAGHGAVFDRDGEPLVIPPSRLGAVEPLYATTIHRSQGSQFDVVAVILPPPGSPLLTRQLLYTAITRARRQLLLVGEPASLRRAVQRPISRATGLERLLWGGSTG
jgi:exodeoxyribonuclease V alpha subunit